MVFSSAVGERILMERPPERRIDIGLGFDLCFLTTNMSPSRGVEEFPFCVSRGPVVPVLGSAVVHYSLLNSLLTSCRRGGYTSLKSSHRRLEVVPIRRLPKSKRLRC